MTRLKALTAALIGAAGLSLVSHAAITRAFAEEAPLPSINLPLEGWTVVAQARGIFKDEFGKLGTEVKLIDPGTTQLIGAEAAMLDRGGLAFAMRMIYPATVQKANGIDASIIWLSEASTPDRTPILALADGPVSKVEDLDGKTLASGRIGCGWTSPTEILEKAGLPLDKPDAKGRVRYTNISNTVANNAALLSGRVEAIATHVALPDVAALVKTGAVRKIAASPADGVYVNAAGRVAYFAMREFVETHPSEVKAFLTSRERTLAWIADHVDEAAAIVAHDTRTPLDIARFNIIDPSQFGFMKGEPDADVAVNAIKTFQKWYIDHGDDILRSRHLSDEQVQAFIDRRFFKGGPYSVYN